MTYWPDLYPMSDIHLAPNPTFPLWLPLVAWNPWTDIRERDDVKQLNITFPFGPVPPSFQVLFALHSVLSGQAQPEGVLPWEGKVCVDSTAIFPRPTILIHPWSRIC